ncbi:hypothetical protein [Rugamonas rubra]|jgi:hypothetical protein|uniref:Uncharacterized protein n=1 Tax=Rugamonas rubra TaxID=758825 RepID=A0A1I4MJM1_9BURK|nr:hypothetical protein [Rugamonas rubra]SFM03253.1 hypothetical protein SAMN02982985_02432 [Rugamonas rubra]
MKRSFAVVLIEGAEIQFLPTLAAHLRKGENGCYFLAKEVEPNGVYMHMTLAPEGDSSGQRGIELHLPHHVIRYVLAAEDVSQVGF